MERLEKKEILSEKDIDFCSATGGIGLVLSLVCLAQLLYVLPLAHWASWPFFSIYIFCAVAFVLLIKKNATAPVCILIGTCLIFIYFAVLIFLFFVYFIFSFSVLMVMLFLFMLAVTVFIYITGFHKKIQQFHQQKKEEGLFWEKKI